MYLAGQLTTLSPLRDFCRQSTGLEETLSEPALSPWGGGRVLPAPSLRQGVNVAWSQLRFKTDEGLGGPVPFNTSPGCFRVVDDCLWAHRLLRLKTWPSSDPALAYPLAEILPSCHSLRKGALGLPVGPPKVSEDSVPQGLVHSPPHPRVGLRQPPTGAHRGSQGLSGCLPNWGLPVLRGLRIPCVPSKRGNPRTQVLGVWTPPPPHRGRMVGDLR